MVVRERQARQFKAKDSKVTCSKTFGKVTEGTTNASEVAVRHGKGRQGFRSIPMYSASVAVLSQIHRTALPS
jgi:hypothetical protein